MWTIDLYLRLVRLVLEINAITGQRTIQRLKSKEMATRCLHLIFGIIQRDLFRHLRMLCVYEKFHFSNLKFAYHVLAILIGINSYDIAWLLSSVQKRSDPISLFVPIQPQFYC